MRWRCLLFGYRRPRIMASILKVDALTGVTTAGSISVTGECNSDHD